MNIDNGELRDLADIPQKELRDGRWVTLTAEELERARRMKQEERASNLNAIFKGVGKIPGAPGDDQRRTRGFDAKGKPYR